MPYIGRAPSTSGSFSIIDDISSSFNASTVAFTLQKSGSNMNVVRDATLLIAVDGVMQEPGSAFTVSGSTITFGSAPLTGASFWGVELGDVGGIAEANAITANAITGAADLGAAPATTDTLVVHDADASAVKEMTVANLFTAPAITGNATAVTQTSGNDSTRIATTEFVQAAMTGDFQIAVTQSSHGLSVGQAVRVSGNDTYVTALATTAANAEVVGVVTSVSGSSFTLTLNGEIATGGAISAADVAAGTVLFLSHATAGLLTPTEPSTAGQVSKPVALVTAQDARMVLLHYRGEIVSTGVQTEAPNDANYLIGTANSGLTAEIVVGTAPGGELGNTWASPTVDSTHSGSAHHAETHGIASHSNTSVTDAELNLLDGGTSVGSSITIADADGFVVNDGGTMKTVPASDVKTYAVAAPTFTGIEVSIGSDAGISRDSSTALTWTQAMHDIVAGTAGSTQWNSSSNQTRIVCKSAGRYYIYGVVAWQASNNNGALELKIKHEGNVLAVHNENGNSESQRLYQRASKVYNLAVDDYLELFVYQDTSSNRACQYLINNSIIDAPTFGMYKIA